MLMHPDQHVIQIQPQDFVINNSKQAQLSFQCKTVKNFYMCQQKELPWGSPPPTDSSPPPTTPF